MSSRERVLLIPSDAFDAPLWEALTYALQAVGFVVGVSGEEQPAAALSSFRPHLLVIDGSLDTAVAVVADLGASREMALLIGLADPVERAEALDAGFGDAAPAPVHPAELVARVAALLRRAAVSVAPFGYLRKGGVTLDEAGHRARTVGDWVSLTSIEVRLLLFLMRHPGIPHRRETLLEEVWGYSIGDLSTVTVHIRRLRGKIEPVPAAPVLITTVWGVGYRFDPMD